MRIPIFLFCIFSLNYAQLSAQNIKIKPKEYTIHKINKAPIIDGVINKKEWRKGSWTDPFVDISDSVNPIPTFETKCKMMWDEDYLYIAAYLEEPDLWGILQTHDDTIYHDHDFEVFLDPNNDGEQYFEIEINALNTVMDLFMYKTYSKGARADMKWNANGLISKVVLHGTLNKNNDIDKGWSIEMAIPFNSLKRQGRISQPSIGSTWRINFSRVEWPMEKKELSYTKRKNSTGKILSENNWVWTPMGVINMHVPEKWGYLHFK